MEGGNISLRWNYDLGGGKFLIVQWRQFDGMNSQVIGRRVMSRRPEVLDTFKSRFKINVNENATLIIINVRRTDTRKYRCEVGAFSGPSIYSAIRLDVICK